MSKGFGVWIAGQEGGGLNRMIGGWHGHWKDSVSGWRDGAMEEEPDTQDGVDKSEMV
jgi:hypothetical protein